ncbi:MAG: TraB/VirB10 family protein [Gammaproteobacteria bacterium]
MSDVNAPDDSLGSGPGQRWQRLPPVAKRAILMGGGASLGLAIVFALTGEPPRPATRTPEQAAVVRELLTDTDPRSLGIDGLSAQIRDLREQSRHLSEQIDRLKTSAGSDAEHAAALQTLQVGQTEQARSLEALRAEMDRPRVAPPAPPGAGHDPGADPATLFATPPRQGMPAFGPPTSVNGGPPMPAPAPAIRMIDGRAESPLATSSTASPARAANATSEGVFIPAGSILSGVLINGMDAATGKAARRDPYPALLRIKHDALLPNRFRADVRECFLIAAGYGDLSSERAYLRGETVSCVREDGGVIEVHLEAYAVGGDGKVGVRGRLVSKQGQVLARALTAGFLNGFGQVFTRQPVPVIATTAGRTTPFQAALSSESLQSGALTGVGDALDRLANFYIDMAQEMFPVIEVDAGRAVEFIVNRGTTLRIAS